MEHHHHHRDNQLEVPMAHLQQQQHAESSSSGPSSAADVRVHVPKHHEGTDYAEETEGQLSKRASSFTLSTVKTHSRPNSWTTEQLEHVIHRKRESGDWFKLGDRFYNPTVLNGQPERPRRHPSLRHQVSRNMLAGLPVTPGGFSGFSTLDMASLARPAANRRVSTASTESFMFRPHPLQRRLTSGSQAGVATGPESKRQSCRKSVTPTAHEAVAEEEEELDTDDQTTRDYVTAASVEPASTEEDENTPGEAWLKTKAKSDAGVLALLKTATTAEWIWMVLGMFCALASGALRPVVTVIFGQVANDMTYAQGTPGYTEQLRAAAADQALIVVYLGIASLVSAFVLMAIFSWVGESIARRLRVRYFRTMLGHDFEFFDRIGTGEMTSRMTADFSTIQESLSEKLPLVFVYLSNFVAGFVVAFAYQWKLAFALLAMLPAIFASFAISKPFISKYSSASMDALSDGSNLVDEVLSSLRVGRAFSTEQKMETIYTGHLDTARNASLRKRSFQGLSVGFNYFFVYSGYACAFFYGTLLITRLEATPGDVVTSFFAVLVGSLGLASLTPCMEALAAAGAASARVHRHLAYQPRTKDQGLNVGPDAVEGRIEFNEISFAYPLRPQVTVLKNFSLSVPAKKTVALVGASGSGKSSAIGLLERFYDNYSGEITLDGQDIKTLRPKSLRSMIGLVTQEPVLFNSTVFDNVALGLLNTELEHVSEAYKRELVQEACIAANAHDFVMSLDEGYDSRVAERGATLSGGQRQRLALVSHSFRSDLKRHCTVELTPEQARALVSKPSILLLDEATAALDATSEEIVQEALNKAASTRTCITVAHRLATVKNADLIVVMHQGLIVEKGTHTELMAKRSYYYDLVTSQDVDKETSSLDEGVDPTHQRDSSTGATPTLVASLDDVSTFDKPRNFLDGTLMSPYGDFTLQVEPPSRAPQATVSAVMLWILHLGWESRWHLFAGLVTIIIFGILYPALSVVVGYFMQAYADGYAQGLTAHEINQTGARFSLYLFLIAIASFAFYWLAGWFLAAFAESLGRNLRKGLFSAMLALPLGWHDMEEHSPNALLGDLTQLPSSLMTFTGATLQSILESITCIFAGIAISVAFGWKLALVTIATIPLTLALGIGRVNMTHKKTVFTENVLGSSSRFGTECLAAIQTVQALAAESEVVRRFEAMVSSTSKPIMKFSILNGLVFAASSAALYFVIALTFWFGMYLLASGEYDVKGFYIVFLAVVLGSSHTTTIFLHATSIAKAWGSAKKAFRMCHEPGQVRPNAIRDSAKRSELLPPAIRTALNNLSLTIRQGQFVGIVGSSGSGKSTIISMLERFYDPTSGMITFNDCPIPNIPLRSFRDAIALVPQDPGLIQGSVRFNLSLGGRYNQEVTEEAMYKALEAANIADFVRELPDGLDTDLGSRAGALSGGQRQRLAIARALLRDPEILLLDEYTAALDAQSEKVVHQALSEASKGRTTIAIAHRIASIQHADVIFVLDKGQVVELGTHADLMNRKERYYELAKAQMLS